ncbi:hypothetical protein ACX40Y_01495 [Sphingomonas sp. RS6]
MYAAAIPEPRPDQEISLAAVGAKIDEVASQLDARFVDAGNALAEAYAIVEKLVGALDAATQAMGREAADGAVENMRATADRLERLPEVQATRQAALARIQQTSKPLRDSIHQINRTLDFLRICGLNIKVAAAGAHGFADFADTMFARIDDGEREMSEIGAEIARLVGGIGSVIDIDRQLADECVKVIPQVPRKLAADAAALQAHQNEVARRAERIAEVAREIRAKVATAIGAMQIGDITRQRLEHVADGLRALIAFREGGEGEAPSPETAIAVSGHMTALFVAQARDTIDGFQQEVGVLAESLRGIVPSAEALVSLQAEAGNAGDDAESGSFLAELERSVSDVAAVTARLRDADGQAQRLGAATSATAERLAARLKVVHRVTHDVHQMAWNTDLRCSRLGNEGRGLAMVASEIRGFANRLADISAAIEGAFEDLVACAAAVRDPQADEADAGQALTESLALIHDGAQRMRDGLSGLDGDTAAVTRILSRATEKIDCDAEVSDALRDAVTRIEPLAAPCDAPDEAIEAPLRALLDQLARSYTMAREREVHRGFVPGGDAAAEAEVADSAAADDDDDFDDGLF